MPYRNFRELEEKMFARMTPEQRAAFEARRKQMLEDCQRQLETGDISEPEED